MPIHTVPRLFRYLLLVIVFNVFLFGLLRVGFWLYFASPNDPMASSAVANAFFIGFKFDVRLALFMVLPLFVLAGLKRLSPFSATGLHATVMRRIWQGWLVATFALALLLFFTHYGYYSYLHVPLDATILRFLDTPDTSLLMMWQSYPMVSIVAGWAVLVVIYALLLNRMFALCDRQPVREVRRRYRIAVATLVSFSVLFGLYGKLSWYPLRWSDAFFSTHPFAAAVTVNPVLHAWSTLKNKDVQYDAEAVSRYYDDMVAYLGIDEPDRKGLRFRRAIQAAPRLAGARPNVVMVFLESFATYKTGLSGNSLNPTPYFDAIARDGLYFKNYFVPHTGTARSVFTAVTGLADVETQRTSTRNPLIVNQHTIINEFVDYQKLYFIGGSASWGNIRGLLSHNLPGLKLYEEGSYQSPRIDVWGISDVHLFEEANQVLKQEQQPFFAVIQTSGNHRPYTIPDDNRGFEILDIPDADVTRHGFASTEEFNAFRFMDHSVRVFIEAARKEAWFDNTVFVFFGDHGIHASAGEHTAKYEAQLGIQGLRVPLVIYAPTLLPEAKTYDVVASEVDLLPTIAGLAVGDYVNTTMGRDLLDEKFKDARYALTITHGQGIRLGLLDTQYYFLMNSDGSNKVLHDLGAASPRDNAMDKFPDKSAQFEKLSRGLFETTRYMRFHNSRD